MKNKISRQLKAEYKRTSSGGQDFELQTSSNAQFLIDIPSDEILTFTDFDVSATKLTMDDRPALMRMIKLVKQGRINKIIVYERDRLARNVYEYIYIVKIFYEHKVEVIFTATDAPAFSRDLFLETWYGLSAQFEGRRISTRLSDARKRNPSSLIGFKKEVIKHENGQSQRFYTPDPKNKDELLNLFTEFAEVKSREQVFEVLMEYRALLDRNEFRVIDILRTPFFAAHYEGPDRTYHKLSHVEPIIPLELFKNVQVKLDEFEYGINDGISLSQKLALIIPLCGKCQNVLKFKKGNIGESGTYYCSKHKKHSISVTELHETIIQSLKLTLSKIKFESIKTITQKAINNQIQCCSKDFDEKYSQLETLCIKFSQHHKPIDNSLTVKRAMNQIEHIKETLSKLENTITSLQNLKVEVNTLTEIVTSKLANLTEKDYFDLADLLISSIQINDDYVLLHYYFNDFFEEGNEQQDVFIS
ncbi:recombinase family protein [Psychrobacillus insolitus]|nr:recombinase family protein [Psychrobacillus insolitus]